MAIRLYLFGLISIFLLSFFLWIILVINVNPYQAPNWIIFLFYFTFFTAASTVFAIANYYLKVWASNREVIFSHFGPSIRQASFMGLIITSCLFFQQIKVLNWWVFSMLVIAVILIELFFRSKK